MTNTATLKTPNKNTDNCGKLNLQRERERGGGGGGGGRGSYLFLISNVQSIAKYVLKSQTEVMFTLSVTWLT